LAGGKQGRALRQRRRGPAVEGHHPTGRVRGKPIHPKLVFRICGPCNREQNLLWAALGIDAEIPDGNVIARRLAAWIDQWGDRPLTRSQAHELALVIASMADPDD
jgi:hypothetical protein